MGEFPQMYDNFFGLCVKFIFSEQKISSFHQIHGRVSDHSKLRTVGFYDA